MPQKRARGDQSPSTRERVLEVAARLFHEQGYESTGTATIAREAGVLPGSLYHFFPSKEHLLRATLEWRLGALKPYVTDPAEAITGDGIERVFALLGRYREGLLQTSCRQGCPVGNLALELSDDHPKIRKLIDANFANWTDVVAGWIASARSRLPRGTDPRALAQFVLVVMEGGIMLARAKQSVEPFDAAVACLRRHFDLMTVRQPMKSKSKRRKP